MTDTPPGADLALRLRHRDLEVRRRARRAVAEALRERGGDVAATAEALGLHPATVRRWRHELPGPQGAEAEVAAPGAGSEPRSPRPGGGASAAPAPAPELTGPSPGPSPFADFRPEHRAPLPPARSGEARGPGRPGQEPAPAPAGPQGHELPSVAAPTPPRPHAPAESSPIFRPAISAPAEEGPRRLAIVLHAHLPWVLGHGTWPHGEEWLAEAVVHCYVPLVEMLRRLGADGRRRLLTFSVTPVLAAQLADSRTPPLVDRYLEGRLTAADALRDHHPLASWWHTELARRRRAWLEMDRDLVGTLAALENDGVVELSTAAATHPYLPLLHRPGHARLQIAAACGHHQALFGRRPRGLWMPECAYRGSGPWHHPSTGAHEPFRPGNEELLAEQGIRWTVVDAHLVLGSEPLTGYGLHWPGEGPSKGAEPGLGELEAQEPPLARRLQPAWIGASRVAAMVREPYTARQVWSRHVGYPGDPRYLDFHKRHTDSGFRLWRVTDAEADLADKLPYWPADATEAARSQAQHFLGLVQSIPGLDGGIAVCPFDAELFGHWWYEGPAWLEEVLRRCGEATEPRTVTPDGELAERPPRQRCELSEGSWGEGGGHEVWLHPDTGWMWQALREAEERVEAAIAGGRRRPEEMRALLAQLMLLAASDWPFLVSRATAADYASERFAEHRRRLLELLDLPAGAPLPSWVEEDLPGMTLDPSWWGPAPALPKRSDTSRMPTHAD